AGKSTLMLALLRLVEASSGSICIDGVDIASLPLATLRSEVGSLGTSESLHCCLSLPCKARWWPFLKSQFFSASHCDSTLIPWVHFHAPKTRFFPPIPSHPVPDLPHPCPNHSQHRDEALWSVLATVRLKPLVAGLLGGLDGALAQGGGNLSLGQKQLLCLAR
ncbi:unnamed protein product, partial [Closterium sp. NIES-53]